MVREPHNEWFLIDLLGFLHAVCPAVLVEVRSEDCEPVLNEAEGHPEEFERKGM